MTPSRVVRVFVALLLLLAIPSFAGAAGTTEFRVLFDYQDGGCEVNGLDGVDLVLVTEASDDGGPMRVTRTRSAVCAGAVLGAPADLETQTWGAGWNDATKLLTLETRIPFSAFGASMPESLIVGFDASRNGSAHIAIANQDGTPIVIPPPPTRRRAVSSGADRHITMDGDLTDWGRIKPAVIGLASTGTPALRLLRIVAWPDTGDHHLYFAATAYLGSDYPYADDNMYLREPGESLVVPPRGVLQNDDVPGGAPLKAQKVSDPARGTVTLNEDGSFTYSPTHPQLLTDDEFEYKAVTMSGDKESNVARVIIQVNQGENPNPPCDQNRPNAPCNDRYDAVEDTMKVVPPAEGVLANDPHGDKLDATLFTAPSHGTVQINADGGFTYKPAKNFFGTDSFVYTATKQAGAPEGIGGNATVTIIVAPVNDPPVVKEATFTLPENSPANTIVGTVQASDPDGDDLTFSIIGGNTSNAFSINGSTGQIRVANPAAIDFEANPTFSLSVRAKDNGTPSESDVETITINLTDTNEPSVVAADGTITYIENDPPTAIEPALTISDTDSTQLAGATVEISGNFAAGQDVLAFTPVGAITGSFSGDTLTLTGTDTIANYELALRSVTYQNTSDNPSIASRTITWVVTDGTIASAGVTSTINVIRVNDEPSFQILSNPPASNEDAGLQTVEDFATSISQGPEESGQTLTFTLTPAGTTGDLAFTTGPSIDASGTLTYTAAPDTNGTATFDVVLTDDGSNTSPNDNTSATLSFTITVNAVNDPPAFTLAGDRVIDEDAGPQTVNGFVTSSSVGPTNENAQTITSYNVTNDNNALFSQQPQIDTAGTLTYQVNANQSGSATVSVTATDSGGATSSPATTFTITVNAVNDEPTFQILADPPASNEDAGLQTVNNFASSINAGAPDEGSQTLTFNLTPNGTTGDLAFTTGPSIDASGTLTYTAAPDTFGTATFDVVLTDNGGGTSPNDNTSATLSFTITVTAVNDPPTFDVAGDQTVSEDSGLHTVSGFASSITVGPTNENTQTITSFNVTNDNNGLFSLQPQIDTAGTLTYTPNLNAFGSATVSVTATDSGGATSSPATTFTITVTPVNDNPVVTAGATLNYTENQAATAVDTTITINDVDSGNITGATVAITNNFASGEDVLSFSNIGPITFVSYTGGVLTLSGTDTVANYQAALRTVAYRNTSDNPSNAARTITWQVNDGAVANNLSVPVTSTVDVAPANDAPTVAAAANLGYTEGDGAVAIDPAVTVTDPDDTQMSGATIAISANYAAGEDVLSFTPVGSITGVFAAGTLTLSGTDSVANYQTALRSVTYNNTSSSPSVSPRTITWTVNDMAAAPGTDTTTISITPVNSKPVVTAGGSLNYTENDPASVIDNTITVNDADTANLVGATVQITGNYVNGQDVLSYAPALGITGVFDDTTGTLTLTGTNTPANWQTALRNVLYTNTSDNPSVAARTVTWIVNDGEAVANLSDAVTSTINITAVNDAPTVAADDLNYTEDAGAVVIDSTVSVNDPDDANLTGATVVITGNCTPGEDILNFSSAFGVSFVSYTPATCTLVLSGSASPAAYASALSSVTYANSSNHPSIAQRTITWTVSDDEPSSGSDTSFINVSRLNDPPAAVGDANATNEDTVLNVPATGVLANDTDPDGGDTKTVVAVNGVGANVGNPVVTGKGATVTLNADGSYSYDPTGSATLQALATGATDDDSFTYTMQDAAGAQSTATVTITITGVNDAPTVAADDFTYTEDAGAVVIDSSVAVADVDDGNLTGATVVITGNCTSGEDLLNFSNAFGVSFVSYTPATCTLVLSGTASPASYASALSAVTYENTSQNPSIAQRTITWTVSDDEPSDGTDTSTIDITRLNDTPTAVDDSNSVLANGTLNVAADGVLANDTDPDAGDTKTVNAVNGSAANVGATISTGQGATLTLNADGSYSYDPTAAAAALALPAGATLNDTFTYTMQDGASATSNTATVTITVTGVNDAPAGTNNTVTTPEETAYNFTAADFGFTDPIDNPDDGFFSVIITTVPGAGALTLAGNPVVAGQEIPVGAIPTLAFTPAANGTGSPYTSFTFQVRDSGGTANGGVNLDPTPNTMSIDVTNVNDAPSGANNTVVTFEDTQYTFTAANFGFTDPNDTPANTLQSVVITTLPAAGALSLSGGGVSAGQDVAVSDITAGNLKFTPAPNGSGAPYTTFTFQVRDNGGTANGGVDLDPSANTMTIDVTAVNDAPAGADNTVTTDEDVQYTFTAANFGFSDPNDTPANTLQSVVITSVPALGGLTLSGNPVTAGNEISAANIAAGFLKFTPVANAFGTPYTTFTFQVRDNGGTANGGVDLDPSANTITINVNPVNDPPVAGDDAWDTIGNTELRIDIAAPTTPHVRDTTNSSTGVRDDDADPVEGDPFTVTSIVGCGDVAAPYDCTLPSGAKVSMNANGTFTYVPSTTMASGTPTNDTFDYVITDAPSVGVAASDTGTVTIHVYDKVWYVKQGAAGGDGTSALPFGDFDSLDGAGGAGDVDAANDYIFVHNSGALALSATVPLEAGQHVLGEGVGLSFGHNLNGDGAVTLVPAGAQPAVSRAAGDLFAINTAVPVEIRGLNLTAPAGNAVAFDSTGALTGSSTLTISNNTIGGAGGDGIDVNLNAGTSGTLGLAITNNTWNLAGTHAGNAIDVVRAAGTLNLDISNNTNVLSTGAAGINVNGAITITGFANNNVHQNTAGQGIVVNNATFDANPLAGYQSVAGGTTVVGASGDGVGTSGVTLTNISGDLTFTDLDVFASNGSGLTITGTGAVNLGGGTGTRVTVPSGVATIASTGGSGVTVNNATVDLRLSGLTVSNSTTTGVSLVNVNDGTTAALFSAPSGSSITTAPGATGPAFNVSGGSVGINYAGTITNNSTVARAIFVDSLSMDDGTDDLTFSGAIDENGAGILLNNNSGASRTINFSGGMDVDTTTGEGFSATSNTNSGGLNITGTNDITSVSATALRITNTTIGSSNVTFRNVSSGNATAAADPANGIVVSNTGASNRLIITGNAGSCTSAATCTGGAIQNTTGNGISLTSTFNPSFTNVYVGGSLGHGINASSMTGLSLTGCQIVDSGDGDNEHGMNLTNVQGTVAVSATTFNEASEDLIHYDNTNVTGQLTVSGSSQFTHPAVVGGFANSAILMIQNGSGVVNSSITGTTFTNIRGAAIQWAPTAAGSSGSATLSWTNNVMNVTTAGRANGFIVSCQENSTGAATITGNNFSGAGGNGVISVDCNDASLLTGTISGNQITNAPGVGMFVAVDESAEVRLTIDNNTVTNSGGDGIQLTNFGDSGMTLDSDFYLAVTNNQVNGHSQSTVSGIAFVGGISIFHFDNVQDTSCIELENNTVTGTPASATRCGGAPCVEYYIQGTTGMTFEEVPNTAATTLSSAYVLANNTGTTADVFGSIALSNGAQCPFP